MADYIYLNTKEKILYYFFRDWNWDHEALRGQLIADNENLYLIFSSGIIVNDVVIDKYTDKKRLRDLRKRNTGIRHLQAHPNIKKEVEDFLVAEQEVQRKVDSIYYYVQSVITHFPNQKQYSKLLPDDFLRCSPVSFAPTPDNSMMSDEYVQNFLDKNQKHLSDIKACMLLKLIQS